MVGAQTVFYFVAHFIFPILHPINFIHSIIQHNHSYSLEDLVRSAERRIDLNCRQLCGASIHQQPQFRRCCCSNIQSNCNNWFRSSRNRFASPNDPRPGRAGLSQNNLPILSHGGGVWMRFIIDHIKSRTAQSRVLLIFLAGRRVLQPPGRRLHQRFLLPAKCAGLQRFSWKRKHRAQDHPGQHSYPHFAAFTHRHDSKVRPERNLFSSLEFFATLTAPTLIELQRVSQISRPMFISKIFFFVIGVWCSGVCIIWSVLIISVFHNVLAKYDSLWFSRAHLEPRANSWSVHAYSLDATDCHAYRCLS